MTDAASDPGPSREGAASNGAAPDISLGPGRALVLVPRAPEPRAFAGLGRSHGFVAAGVAAVMGLGFVGATALFASRPSAVAAVQVPADPSLDLLTRVQGEVRALRAGLDGLRATAEAGPQVDTMRALKKSVDVLRGDLDTVKAASATAVGQLGAKIDRLDRDPGPKLNEIAARLDRLDHEPDARIAQVASQLTARLERVERQVAAADTTGSVPAGTAATAQAAAPSAPLPPPRLAQPSPTAAAALPAAAPSRPGPLVKPEPTKAEPQKAEAAPRPDAVHQEAANRPAAVEGWLLRDVYDGVALVEGRAGGLREVSPGDHVPGAGEVRSIERRGRGWVVVTSRGLIQADNRW